MGTLLLKTVSKPIANQIKQQAKGHPVFQKFCIATGQQWSSFTTRMNMRVLGHRIKQVKPLSESAAVARGADFLGDAFVYTVATTALLIEYSRSRRESQKKAAEKAIRQAQKREALKKELAEMNEKIMLLDEKCDMLLAQLRENRKQESQVSWSGLSLTFPRFHENFMERLQSQQSFTGSLTQGWLNLYKDDSKDEWN